MLTSVISLIIGIDYLINDSFQMNIYRMAIKCIIIIILLVFKYSNNGKCSIY